MILYIYFEIDFERNETFIQQKFEATIAIVSYPPFTISIFYLFVSKIRSTFDTLLQSHFVQLTLRQEIHSLELSLITVQGHYLTSSRWAMRFNRFIFKFWFSLVEWIISNQHTLLVKNYVKKVIKHFFDSSLTSLGKLVKCGSSIRATWIVLQDMAMLPPELAERKDSVRSLFFFLCHSHSLVELKHLCGGCKRSRTTG